MSENTKGDFWAFIYDAGKLIDNRFLGFGLKRKQAKKTFEKLLTEFSEGYVISFVEVPFLVELMKERGKAMIKELKMARGCIK